jgi:Tfp pilus assembly protein PilF
MRLFSTTALAVAIAMGATTVATIAPQPALAKEKAPSLKLSEVVRKPLAEAQEALKNNDTATAQAKINEAKGLAKTEDDKFMVYQMLYDVTNKTTKDTKVQQEAIGGMLQTGKVPAEAQPNYYVVLGQLAFNNKDFTTADQALSQAIKLNASDPVIYVLLAETKNQLGKPAEAVALVQQVADAGEAKGTPVPQDWIARGIAIGSKAKLAAPVTKLSYNWLKAYPTQSNWRDSLLIYRDSHQLDSDAGLDLMRLQRAAKALRGERDYVELAEATYIRFPNEAKTLIDEGVASGALNLAQNRGAKEIQGLAAGRVAGDKASLKKTASTGRAALATADAFASYGDTASAIEMYRKALTMSDVDANVVNTRLGATLVAAGQKEEAKKIFTAITGPRADLAAYWVILIDHPPAAS